MQRTKKVPAPDVRLAAELGKQGPKEKLERYQTARESTANILPFLNDCNSPLKRYHQVVSDCASWLVFRHYYQANETRVIKANFCRKQLLCQVCAMRRSALQVREYEKKLRSVLDQDMVPVLVTLTVKNGVCLNDRFQHIDQALTRLIKKRHDSISKGRKNTIMRHVLGGAGSYEFKRGSGSDLWHPHAHQIWLLRKGDFAFAMRQRKKRMVWVPLEFEKALRGEWKALTGDSFMVDVRRIETENDKDRFGALCEAFKYSLKLNDLEPKDQIAAAEVLQGRRLQRSFGNLYGVEIDEKLEDDHDENLGPYLDLVYQYNSAGYVLIEKTDYGPMTAGQKKRRKRNNGYPDQTYSGFDQNYTDHWLKEKRKEAELTTPF